MGSAGVGSGSVGLRFSGVLAVVLVVLVAEGAGAAAHQSFAKATHSNPITTGTSGGGNVSSGNEVFNIRSLGAVGDGATDDTQVFLAAWGAACRSTSGLATVLVPRGYQFFLASDTKFSGKNCISKIVFQVDGDILGPGDKSKWKNAKASSASWMQFTDCKDFSLRGTGTLDARGQSFWAARKGGPMAIRFLRGVNVAVIGITIRHSPQVHLKFNVCNGGLVQGITIDSPDASPNTDGIHLQTDVYNFKILDCVIKSGDDCISIGTGTHDLTIKGIMCGPGHGISIGSLGNKGLLACVSDIDISDVTFINTLCGCRIKTCAGGKGKATRISYRDIRVVNVKYPILIDQYYCGKARKANNVILDHIEFSNVRGTAALSKIGPVYMDCAAPGCSNVRLQDIAIDQNSKPAFCSYSYGTFGGQMQPAGCLQYKVQTQSQSVPGCAA